MRFVPKTRFVCQRTIFEVKNKKFIPKKIQFTVDSTAASSCSNFPAPIESNLRSYLYPSCAEQDTQNVVAFATPVKKVREAYALDKQPGGSYSPKKAQPSRFDANGAFMRITRGTK